MPYRINGAQASFAPMSQQWIDTVIGKNLAGKTIYSPLKEVILKFDVATVANFGQWHNSTSGGSVGTMTILGPDNLTFTAYSTVYLTWENRPEVKNGMAQQWAIRLSNITA